MNLSKIIRDLLHSAPWSTLVNWWIFCPLVQCQDKTTQPERASLEHPHLSSLNWNRIPFKLWIMSRISFKELPELSWQGVRPAGLGMEKVYRSVKFWTIPSSRAWKKKMKTRLRSALIDKTCQMIISIQAIQSQWLSVWEGCANRDVLLPPSRWK